MTLKELQDEIKRNINYLVDMVDNKTATTEEMKVWGAVTFSRIARQYAESEKSKCFSLDEKNQKS